MKKDILTETFNKHVKLLHKKLNLVESVGSQLSNWLDSNSSGYETEFDASTIAGELNIKMGSQDFNSLVDAFKDRGFELVKGKFVKNTSSEESGVSDEEVKNTADDFIQKFKKGSSNLRMIARDFYSLSIGGGDPDMKERYSNWSKKNFSDILDIFYTTGGLDKDDIENSMF